LLLIDLVSLFGNSLLCLVIYRTKTLQTVTNLLILVLAISDIVMAILGIPFSVAVLIRGEWIFGTHICRMQCFLIYFLAFGSLQTITIVAVNRYYRVLKPVRYKKVFTFKSTSLILFLVWFVTAALLTIPFLAGAIVPDFSPSKAACVIFTKPGASKQAVIAVNVALVSIAAIIPSAVISFCYFRVFRAVGNHFTRVKPTLRSHHRTQQSTNISEIKSTRTLFFVLLAYFICWIPVFAIEALQTFIMNWWLLPRSCHLLWTFCGCLSSAVNPFVFGLTSRSFRQGFKVLFRRVST
ncbi:predicted protein, partial [Nematostella vectensis]